MAKRYCDGRMQATSSPTRWDRPVFVASMGRSGSTLLQRLLNVHPDLTIWGEHGAFLSGILDSYAITKDEHVEKNLLDGYEHRHAVIGELSDKAIFKPWVSPFQPDHLADGLRRLTTDLFTAELSPEVRWGFKEIRYRQQELEPLMDLFPESHLIVLARDLPGYIGSRFFAFGQKDFDFTTDAGRAKAAKKVGNLVNGWIQRYQGLVTLAESQPDRSSFVAYSDLVAGSDRPARLFAELGEAPVSAEALEMVLGEKSGSSFKFNSEARSNRAPLLELLDDLDYDRDEYGRLSAVLGLS